MMDRQLLLLGVVRVVFWAAGMLCAWRLRPYLPVTSAAMLVGFSLATFGSVVFAISNSGGDVPDWLFTLATVSATPAAALIVTTTSLLIAYYIRHRIKLLEEHRGRW
jgi:Kef-type K+ transport system membrane component KefB